MGCCCTVVTLGLLGLLAYFAKKIYNWLYTIPEIPYVDENYWWGQGPAKADEDTSITPFKIHFSDKDLDDLKQRLVNTRPFTPPLEGIKHEYGFNTNLLQEIKDFWISKYNWREREAFFNQLHQYKTKIQGLNIHFLHVKPTETNGLKVVPLLLLHGWPGSLREFYEVIPKLTSPSAGRNFVFEVVAPHIPGYGFSEAAARPGLNATTVAVIFKNLMVRLQFEKWYVQGGDWGSEIGTQMALLYPKNVLGLHLNMAIVQMPMANVKRLLGSFCPSLVVSEKHKSKMYPLKTLFLGLIRETGYMHLQATRPDSLGVALNDSPLGMAAYLLEKFIVGTNKDYLLRQDGGLTLKFNYEKLLDNIMIYWINSCNTTAMRLYAENFSLSNPFRNTKGIPVEVPSAYAQFGDDPLYVSETLLKEKLKNLVQYSELPSGGHFAALEEPDLFVGDVFNAVEKFENYHAK